jgi:hypothetical protein
MGGSDDPCSLPKEREEIDSAGHRRPTKAPLYEAEERRCRIGANSVGGELTQPWKFAIETTHQSNLALGGPHVPCTEPPPAPAIARAVQQPY